MPQNDQALLTRLKAAGLEFVVIGGVCAVYHGATIATFDLDICCPFGEENVNKIESAVAGLHAVHRLTANKLPLEETRTAFSELKNLYLQTDLGKIDCLSAVKGIGSYQDVFNRSVLARLPYGEFRFLNLEGIIAAKEAVGRDQDLYALKFLKAIEERLKRQPNLKLDI